MSEEFEFSKVQENFIDKVKKEIDFVKNVADVKEIPWHYGDGDVIVGLDEDKQKFFTNGKSIIREINLSDFNEVDFLYYKHKDGTEVFLQDIPTDYSHESNELFVKGQDYVCYHAFKDFDDEDDEGRISVSIGKLGQEKPDAKVVFRGTNDIEEGVGPNNPDLYDLYNRYIPQDVNVKKVLSELNRIKSGLEKSQQKVNDKIIEARILKSALDKWNRGK